MNKRVRIVVVLVLGAVALFGQQGSASASCTQPTTEETPCVETVVCETAGRVLDWMCIE